MPANPFQHLIKCLLKKLCLSYSMHFIFATNNDHKIQEIRSVIGESISIKTLREAGIDTDIAEPHATLEENAREKSMTIWKLTGSDCFSEDTGLETAALNGEPGVKSARYAGDGRSATDNMQLLLQKLAGETNRAARFRTIISLIIDGRETQFEGICPGYLTTEPRGTTGFGYDPIFIPDGSSKTFAEMSMEEKNQFSHREKATRKLVTFLNNLTTNHKN